MTGTVYNCLYTNQSRSYLNHLVYWNTLTMHGPLKVKFRLNVTTHTYSNSELTKTVE